MALRNGALRDADVSHATSCPRGAAQVYLRHLSRSRDLSPTNSCVSYPCSCHLAPLPASLCLHCVDTTQGRPTTERPQTRSILLFGTRLRMPLSRQHIPFVHGYQVGDAALAGRRPALPLEHVDDVRGAGQEREVSLVAGEHAEAVPDGAGELEAVARVVAALRVGADRANSIHSPPEDASSTSCLPPGGIGAPAACR